MVKKIDYNAVGPFPSMSVITGPAPQWFVSLN